MRTDKPLLNVNRRSDLRFMRVLALLGCACLIVGAAWADTAQYAVSQGLDDNPAISASQQDPPAEKGLASDADEPAAKEKKVEKPPFSTASGKPPISIRPAAKDDDKKDAAKQAPSKGCGASGKAGPPKPTPVGPQPKYVCKEPKCVLDPLWRGDDAVFKFTISNEGEGELHIQLKGG